MFDLSFWQNFAVKYGAWGLALNSFIEAIFFPIPPDVLLITLCILNPKSSFLYMLIATLFSSLGGVGGYYLGYIGGKPLAVRFFGLEKVNRVHILYQSYESLVILLAGFTPIPYKVFTITSGVLFASLKKLMLFSFIGRGGRFFIEAFLIYLYGKRIEGFVMKNLNLISIAFGIILTIGFLIYRRYKKGVLP